MNLNQNSTLNLELLEQELGREIARRSILDFATRTFRGRGKFQPSTFHRKLASVLDGIASGELTRVILSAPPRHGKSELVTRNLPAYLLGLDPSTKIIAASYGQSLADKMGRDVQRKMVEPEYKAIFPEVEFSEIKRVNEFETTQGGGCKFVGVGGPITGFGGNGIIIDDPHKSRKEAESELERENVWNWYNDDILSRLEGVGFVLVMATRWHADDLIGRILAEDDADEWVVLNFPAIYDEEEGTNAYDWRKFGEGLWPERYKSFHEYYADEEMPAIPQHAKVKPTLVTREDIAERYLDKMRKLEQKNAYGFAALYQGRPRPKDGGIVRPGAIQSYTGDPEERFLYCDDLLISVDANFKVTKTSDYASIQVLGRSRNPHAVYLIEEIHERFNYPQLKAAVLTFWHKYPRARLLIEAKANGQALIDDLRAVGIPVVPFEPGTYGSKENRAQIAADHINGGVFWVPLPKYKSDVSVYIEDVEGFGFRKHDDRMDALAQAMIHWSGSASPLDHLKRVLGLI